MISRRIFLTAAAGLGCLAALPAGAAADAGKTWQAAAGDRAAARVVGVQCIRCGAAEADVDQLVDRLQKALAGNGLAYESDDPASLRAALRLLRRADFTAGNVVNVDGWVLSRSEARVYALAALSAPLV